MTSLIVSWFNLLGFVTISVLGLLYVYYRLFTAKYWSVRNVPHVEPTFLLGSLWRANFFENQRQIFARLHRNFRDKKMVGIWNFHIPVLMVTDLDLIKRILVSDFNIFRDRGLEIDEERDPLTGHLFLLSKKKWRNLRVKLTPTFSSGKMKMMFPTVLKCGEELREHLKAPSATKEVTEVKDLFARFTTDVIGSCAFGLETNTLKNPKSEFRKYGDDIFRPTYPRILKNIVILTLPKIAKMLRLRFVPKDITKFFINLVDDTIKYRERTNTVRNDFLQLLIQLMRAGKIEDVDKTPVDNLKDEEIVHKFSLNEAAAQCFVFFAAGFETSATTLTFAFYELALNPDIQSRLQSEIDSILADGEVTYDKVIGLEYLDMVVQETLRKYPPVGNLQRKCLSDYRVPEMDVTINEGTTVLISVAGIQYDPILYPEPEKFDPERFSREEREKRHLCAYLPFGEGPRSCIGNRFGLMQVKVGLISVLRDYNVEVTKTTPIPLKISPKSVILAVDGGVNLVFSKRS